MHRQVAFLLPAHEGSGFNALRLRLVAVELGDDAARDAGGLHFRDTSQQRSHVLVRLQAHAKWTGMRRWQRFASAWPS